MLRFNWIQRQEYYQERRQNEGQAEDLARQAEWCCMAIVSSWRDNISLISFELRVSKPETQNPKLSWVGVALKLSG